jgi:hypothetical protein
MSKVQKIGLQKAQKTILKALLSSDVIRLGSQLLKEMTILLAAFSNKKLRAKYQGKQRMMRCVLIAWGAKPKSRDTWRKIGLNQAFVIRSVTALHPAVHYGNSDRFKGVPHEQAKS